MSISRNTLVAVTTVITAIVYEKVQLCLVPIAAVILYGLLIITVSFLIGGALSILQTLLPTLQSLLEQLLIYLLIMVRISNVVVATNSFDQRNSSVGTYWSR